jgi:mono/diheme cytochrome c family protein
MKLRNLILLAALSIIISACNFTLAQDVTPPPGYVAPTPLPTLVLIPSQAPNVENGKVIYAEKCAACHGETGMGDGEQGIQLGVTVPAFGLSEVARPATLAEWYTVVTRGRMDRLMPPFTSLNDQERWDVAAYAMTLHTTEEQIAKGKEIFESKCVNCSTDFFEDQSKMSALNEVDLARIVKQGNEAVPAFGSDLIEDEMWAVAMYLRSLSFDTASAVAQAPASTATPEAASVTDAPAATDAGTPAAEGTPIGTEQAAATNEPTAVVQEGLGSISGTIDNQTGADLPSDLKVTLRGFDHGADPSAGPQEVFTQETSVNEDGSYSFENVEIPSRRIFIAEVAVDGVQMQSPFVIVEEGSTALTIPAVVVYGMTDDISLLIVDEVRMFFDYGDADIQVVGIYSFRNPSDKTVIVDLENGNEIPFIRIPEGSSLQGYEALQDSKPFVNTEKGFAIPPGDGSYGLAAFTTVPKQKEFEITQPFVLPVLSLSVLLPEGVTAEGNRLVGEGQQAIQNFNFEVYSVTNIPAGEILKFTVSGQPDEASGSTAEAATVNQNLLFGAAALGLALIAAGAWLYMRDRNTIEDADEGDEEEFDSSEEVLDAIVALDDLRRDKKISEEAYRKRRAELKDILKGMM